MPDENGLVRKITVLKKGKSIYHAQPIKSYKVCDYIPDSRFCQKPLGVRSRLCDTSTVVEADIVLISVPQRTV